MVMSLFMVSNFRNIGPINCNLFGYCCYSLEDATLFCKFDSDKYNLTLLITK